MLENRSLALARAVSQELSTTSRSEVCSANSRPRSPAGSRCAAPSSSARASKPSPLSRSNPPWPMKWKACQPPRSRASCRAHQVCPPTHVNCTRPSRSRLARAWVRRHLFVLDVEGLQPAGAGGHGKNPKRRGDGQWPLGLEHVQMAHQWSAQRQVVIPSRVIEELPRQRGQLGRPDPKPYPQRLPLRGGVLSTGDQVRPQLRGQQRTRTAGGRTPALAARRQGSACGPRSTTSAAPTRASTAAAPRRTHRKETPAASDRLRPQLSGRSPDRRRPAR